MTAETPTTSSPWRSTIRRSTPCVDGWFGPKLTRRRSSLSRSAAGTSSTVGTRDGMREPSYWSSATIGQRRLVDGKAVVLIPRR